MKSEDMDPYGIPKEVYTSPFPLIGMAGLDIEQKKSHRSVWEAFTLNRRSDRIPLKFILFPDKMEFPAMKQKRQSYEWYIPKGILKSNWINKYLDSIPSLLVLFWDLDWSDPNWADEKKLIAASIQSIKLALSGRPTRIAVVLIQSNSAPSVPGEDGNGASEKAVSLCAACDLPPKHLFVLPHTASHLLGYTMRLENALSEIGGGFYLGEIKGIKAHKDFLNKTNHQLLFIRHQFKVAFHNELRSDPQTAIKHYNQCYHHLLEHRFTNTNLHEIRTVASIVNYKICKLDFVLNLPRDAIEQFRRHIEVFRQRTGPKELIFEHYAWLSKQYHIFGEVFEEAVREGLPAVQTQHPGFYYQQAAQYAVLRRNTAYQVCKDVSSAPEGNLLSGWSSLEFYGQRPWRPGKHSLEPPEMHTETEGVKAICHHEMQRVDHSSLIVPQFSSAITQFKKYRCPRIKRYLMVQMAKEYQHAQDPAKALTLLNHVMWDYRSERWWCLLSSCSPLALSCAYQVANIQEYLALCLEILGPRIVASEEEKEDAFHNLFKIINHSPPSPPPGLSEDASSSASESWCFTLPSSPSPSRASLVVKMDDILPCLEIRAGFVAAVAPVDGNVEAVVKIRNHLDRPLSLFSLTVHTDHPSALLKETDPVKLVLPAKETVAVPLSFQPAVNSVDKVVKIKDVTACLGSCPDKTVTLHWTGVGKEGVNAHTGSTPSYKEFGSLYTNPVEAEELHPKVTIISRNPKLDVELQYDASALVWEWLPVSFSLRNGEAGSISDVAVAVGLEPGADASLERTTQICSPSNLETKSSTSSISSHPLPNLAQGERISCLFYFKALTAAKRTFQIKISYKCDIELETKVVVCPTVFSKSFGITSKIPFQITIEPQSLRGFRPLSQVAKRERFVVVPKIKCFSHVPIHFVSSSVGLASDVESEGESVSMVTGVEVVAGEEATDCFCVSVRGGRPGGAEAPVALGQYLLYWKRADDPSSPSPSSCPPVSVSIALPSIRVEDVRLWIEADLPPQGIVRTPLTVGYEMTNTGDEVQELSVSMHVSDAFMFSGHKEVRLRLLPGWQECLTYTVYPLLAGYVQLPRLRVTMETPSQKGTPPAPLDDFIDRILPSHLFVMPQEKPNANLNKEDSQSLLRVR